MYKKLKIRVNLNTKESKVIEEKIQFDDNPLETDAYCEHIIQILEERKLFPVNEKTGFVN